MLGRSLQPYPYFQILHPFRFQWFTWQLHRVKTAMAGHIFRGPGDAGVRGAPWSLRCNGAPEAHKCDDARRHTRPERGNFGAPTGQFLNTTTRPPPVLILAIHERMYSGLFRVCESLIQARIQTTTLFFVNHWNRCVISELMMFTIAFPAAGRKLP